jgi:hypothetical protein
MTADPITDPEGVELVARIHARKLSQLKADLAKQDEILNRLVSEASSHGTKPEAHICWELVHERAGIKATIQSRIQHFITRHLIGDDPDPQPSRLDRMDGIA